MNVNGTEVTVTDGIELPDAEILKYLSYLRNKHPGERIKNLAITITANVDRENVVLDYTMEAPKFERIRRITGYLVGSIDRWNNAKRAEEHDRVKHKISL